MWKWWMTCLGGLVLKILLSSQITSGTTVLSRLLYEQKRKKKEKLMCVVLRWAPHPLICEPHAFFTMRLITFSEWFFIFNQLQAPWGFTYIRVAINMQYIHIRDMHLLFSPSLLWLCLMDSWSSFCSFRTLLWIWNRGWISLSAKMLCIKYKQNSILFPVHGLVCGICVWTHITHIRSCCLNFSGG